MIYLNDQGKWPLQVVLRQFVVEGDKLAIVGADNADQQYRRGADQPPGAQGGDDPADHRADPGDLPADFEVLHQGHDDRGR